MKIWSIASFGIEFWRSVIMGVTGFPVPPIDEEKIVSRTRNLAIPIHIGTVEQLESEREKSIHESR